MDQRKRNEDQRKTRKAYARPAVEETAEFETLAMSCGKQPMSADLNCIVSSQFS